MIKMKIWSGGGDLYDGGGEGIYTIYTEYRFENIENVVDRVIATDLSASLANRWIVASQS